MLVLIVSVPVSLLIFYKALTADWLILLHLFDQVQGENLYNVAFFYRIGLPIP